MRLWEVFGFKKSLFEETEDFWEGINKSFVYIDHLIETDPGMAALNARADPKSS